MTGLTGLTRGVLALLAVAFGALVAPLLAPHDPDEMVDVASARYLPPGAHLFVFSLADSRTLAVEKFVIEERTLAYRRAGEEGSIPLEALSSTVPQRRRFLLGTDPFGRDLLSRVLHGARVSLSLGLIAVAIGVALGAASGAVSGYLGGWADAALMRLVDVLNAVPRLFLFLMCAALFGPSALLLVLVLGGTGWMGIARITRGQVLSIRQRPFVEAAQALGGGTLSILGRHVLPQCAGTLAVSASLLAADTILAESSLSFIGLGIQPPSASWGNIIAAGRDALVEAWWISAFPGLAILATVLILYGAGRAASREAAR